MTCYHIKKSFFWLILLLLFSALPVSATQEPQIKTDKLANKPKKIAVCYWGLTRSTKKVYKSHFDNFFNLLTENDIQFDVFMHTWQLKDKQRVWEKEIDHPVDYEEYKLLNPTFYKIDKQDDFTDTLEFDKYFYKGNDDSRKNRSRGDWPPNIAEKLILNHLCALESLKRVTEMVESSGNAYELIVYIRPDVELTDKFPVENICNMKDFDILIPNFDHWAGYNDRFAVLTYNTAPIYGKRIQELAEFRRTQGRITSERYVKYVCDVNHLNVILINFHFNIIRP